MLYKFLADTLIIVHLLFICFVVFGALLQTWSKKWVYLHLPAAVWGALIEFKGWICPLTYLENKYRFAGGLAGYEESFVEHYLLPIIYPAGLTPQIQYVLGSLVIIVNFSIYGYFFWRYYINRAKN